MSEGLIAQIMYKIFKAVAALHEEDICHRDLKLENILIDEEDNKIKIIDFGMADKVDKEKGIEGYHGTLQYLAPEVVEKKDSYTEKCDIWSMGVILYALFTQKFPFNGLDK